jgi:ATP-dependent RNA helicase DDX49/DBP8
MQYDVELVHAIEGLMGAKLAAHDMPEEEVLKGITRVYAAKKKAALEAIDLEQREGGKGGAARRRQQGGRGGG